MSSSSKDVNASEALLLKAIRKMKPYRKIEGISEPYSDLQEVLHILRSNKLKEGGGRELSYDVCDVVELARDLIDCYTGNDMLFIAVAGIGDHLWRCVGGVKTRMLSSESTMMSDNIVGQAESIDDGNVVGLEDVVQQLLGREIFGDEPALSRLIMEGTTGLGKTALVRKLYSHARVVNKFERRAWLRVPSDFSHKGVLMKLIQQVVDSDGDDERSSLAEKMMHADIPTLQKTLHRHLLGRQYLIVIDDVPEEMYLGMIYKGLPSEDKGSRMLLTGRFENLQATATQYKMKPLNPDHSWELFMQTIFGGNRFTSDHDDFPKLLERKAKEMLTRCGGVPSAIKNVGMQVARMRELLGN